jgi:DNA-binding response OmpR family regulator
MVSSHGATLKSKAQIPMALIHLLEDDDIFAGSVQAVLARAGHDVHCFVTPHAFFYQLGKMPPRCAIVDWMLPEMIGVDVIRRLRQQVGRGVGVIMLTAIDAEKNVVEALEAGADDYLVKPGTNAVLTARVDALLRRLASDLATTAKRFTVGPYTLDFALQTVTLNGSRVELAPREFDLTWTLFSSPSRLFTKQELLASIWGRSGEVGHHTIAQHIYAVRKKLCLAEHGFKLLAVYATGYRLEWPDGAVV